MDGSSLHFCCRARPLWPSAPYVCLSDSSADSHEAALCKCPPQHFGAPDQPRVWRREPKNTIPFTKTNKTLCVITRFDGRESAKGTKPLVLTQRGFPGFGHETISLELYPLYPTTDLLRPTRRRHPLRQYILLIFGDILYSAKQSVILKAAPPPLCMVEGVITFKGESCTKKGVPDMGTPYI